MESLFWADEIAAEAIKANTNIKICTGITPSGQIHIGNMREVLSGDAVYRSIKQQGAAVSFVFIADTFDSLRKVYPFLDESVYSQYVGCPISEIPCPCGKHDSYADHFLDPFLASIEQLGLELEVIRADRMYKEGKYTDAIYTSLERRDEIAAILSRVTGKEIEAAWSPVNCLCNQCGRNTVSSVQEYSRSAGTITYSCQCGHNGTCDPSKGGAKLTWRVDWAARWSILGVTVEPFGKDHASRGGSYDTGICISKEIFGYEPPIPVVYEWISLKGQGDMSSSKGNVLSISDMLEVVPPDVLRYLVFRTKPKKAIAFDPGLPLLNLVDELDNQDSKNRDPRAYELSIISSSGSPGIPFNHLVNIVQIAGDNDDDAIAIVKRGGYPISNEDALTSRMHYARKWLANYAPENIKFAPMQDLPEAAKALLPDIKKGLMYLAEHLNTSMNGEAIHELFYAAKDHAGISPNDLFQGIYTSLIGKERGPRAGWFVETIGIEFAAQRFKEAATS